MFKFLAAKLDQQIFCEIINTVTVSNFGRIVPIRCNVVATRKNSSFSKKVEDLDSNENKGQTQTVDDGKQVAEETEVMPFGEASATNAEVQVRLPVCVQKEVSRRTASSPTVNGRGFFRSLSVSSQPQRATGSGLMRLTRSSEKFYEDIDTSNRVISLQSSKYPKYPSGERYQCNVFQQKRCRKPEFLSTERLFHGHFFQCMTYSTKTTAVNCKIIQRKTTDSCPSFIQTSSDLKRRYMQLRRLDDLTDCCMRGSTICQKALLSSALGKLTAGVVLFSGINQGRNALEVGTSNLLQPGRSRHASNFARKQRKANHSAMIECTSYPLGVEFPFPQRARYDMGRMHWQDDVRLNFPRSGVRQPDPRHIYRNSHPYGDADRNYGYMQQQAQTWRIFGQPPAMQFGSQARNEHRIGGRQFEEYGRRNDFPEGYGDPFRKMVGPSSPNMQYRHQIPPGRDQMFDPHLGNMNYDNMPQPGRGFQKGSWYAELSGVENDVMDRGAGWPQNMSDRYKGQHMRMQAVPNKIDMPRQNYFYEQAGELANIPQQVPPDLHFQHARKPTRRIFYDSWRYEGNAQPQLHFRSPSQFDMNIGVKRDPYYKQYDFPTEFGQRGRAQEIDKLQNVYPQQFHPLGVGDMQAPTRNASRFNPYLDGNRLDRHQYIEKRLSSIRPYADHGHQVQRNNYDQLGYPSMPGIKIESQKRYSPPQMLRPNIVDTHIIRATQPDWRFDETFPSSNIPYKKIGYNDELIRRPYSRGIYPGQNGINEPMKVTDYGGYPNYKQKAMPVMGPYLGHELVRSGRKYANVGKQQTVPLEPRFFKWIKEREKKRKEAKKAKQAAKQKAKQNAKSQVKPVQVKAPKKDKKKKGRQRWRKPWRKPSKQSSVKFKVEGSKKKPAAAKAQAEVKDKPHIQAQPKPQNFVPAVPLIELPAKSPSGIPMQPKSIKQDNASPQRVSEKDPKPSHDIGKQVSSQVTAQTGVKPAASTVKPIQEESVATQASELSDINKTENATLTHTTKEDSITRPPEEGEKSQIRITPQPVVGQTIPKTQFIEKSVAPKPSSGLDIQTKQPVVVRSPSQAPADVGAQKSPIPDLPKTRPVVDDVNRSPIEKLPTAVGKMPEAPLPATTKPEYIGRSPTQRPQGSQIDVGIQRSPKGVYQTKPAIQHSLSMKPPTAGDKLPRPVRTEFGQGAPSSVGAPLRPTIPYTVKTRPPAAYQTRPAIEHSPQRPLMGSGLQMGSVQRSPVASLPSAAEMRPEMPQDIARSFTQRPQGSQIVVGTERSPLDVHQSTKQTRPDILHPLSVKPVRTESHHGAPSSPIAIRPSVEQLRPSIPYSVKTRPSYILKSPHHLPMPVGSGFQRSPIVHPDQTRPAIEYSPQRPPTTSGLEVSDGSRSPIAKLPTATEMRPEIQFTVSKKPHEIVQRPQGSQVEVSIQRSPVKVYESMRQTRPAIQHTQSMRPPINGDKIPRPVRTELNQGAQMSPIAIRPTVEQLRPSIPYPIKTQPSFIARSPHHLPMPAGSILEKTPTVYPDQTRPAIDYSPQTPQTASNLEMSDVPKSPIPKLPTATGMRPEIQFTVPKKPHDVGHNLSQRPQGSQVEVGIQRSPIGTRPAMQYTPSMRPPIDGNGIARPVRTELGQGVAMMPISVDLPKIPGGVLSQGERKSPKIEKTFAELPPGFHLEPPRKPMSIAPDIGIPQATQGIEQPHKGIEKTVFTTPQDLRTPQPPGAVSVVPGMGIHQAPQDMEKPQKGIEWSLFTRPPEFRSPQLPRAMSIAPGIGIHQGPQGMQQPHKTNEGSLFTRPPDLRSPQPPRAMSMAPGIAIHQGPQGMQQPHKGNEWSLFTRPPDLCSPQPPRAMSIAPGIGIPQELQGMQQQYKERSLFTKPTDLRSPQPPRAIQIASDEGRPQAQLGMQPHDDKQYQGIEWSLFTRPQSIKPKMLYITQDAPLPQKPKMTLTPEVGAQEKIEWPKQEQQPGTFTNQTSSYKHFQRTNTESRNLTRPGFEWNYSQKSPQYGTGDRANEIVWRSSGIPGVGLEVTEMLRSGDDWNYGARPGLEWRYSLRPSFQGVVMEEHKATARQKPGLDLTVSKPKFDKVGFGMAEMTTPDDEWSHATRPRSEWSYSDRPSGSRAIATRNKWRDSGRAGVDTQMTQMRRPSDDQTYDIGPELEWSHAQRPSIQGDVIETPGTSPKTFQGLDWSGSRRGAVGSKITEIPRTDVEWTGATRQGLEWNYFEKPPLTGAGGIVTVKDGSVRAGIGLEMTETRRPTNDWNYGTRQGLEWSYGTKPELEWSYEQKPSLQGDAIEAPAISARTIKGLDWSGSRRPGAVDFKMTGSPRTCVEWTSAPRPGFELSHSERPSLRGPDGTVIGKDGFKTPETRRPASDWSYGTRPELDWSSDTRPELEWSNAQRPSFQGDMIEAPGMSARTIHGLDWSGTRRPSAVGIETTRMPRTGVKWSRATRPGFEWSYSRRSSLGEAANAVTGKSWSGSARAGVGHEMTEMGRPATDWSSGTRPGLEWSYGSRPRVEWSYAQKPSFQGDMIEAPGMSAGTIQPLDWSGSGRTDAVGIETTRMPRTVVEWSPATNPGFEWSYSARPSLGGVGDTVTARDWSGSDRTGVGLKITEMRRPANDWSYGTRPELEWSSGTRPELEWSNAQRPSFQGDMIEAPGMSARTIHGLDWSGSRRPGAVGFETTGMPRTGVEWSRATRPGFEWSYSGRPSLGGESDAVTGRNWSGRTGVGHEITEMRRPANDWSSGTRPGLEWGYGSRPGVEWSYPQKPSLQRNVIEAPGMSARTIHGLDWSGSRKHGAVGFETTGMPITGVEWSRATRPGFEWSYSGRQSLGGVGDTVTGRDWSGSGRTGVGLEITEMRRPGNDWSSGTRPGLELSYGSRPGVEWSYPQKPSLQGDVVEAPAMSARTIHGLDWSGSRRPGAVGIETTGMPRTGVEWSRATRPSFEWSYSGRPSLGGVGDTVTGRDWSGSDRTGVGFEITEMRRPANDWSSGTRPGLEWSYGSRPGVEWSYAQKPSLQGDVIEAPGMSPKTIHGLDWSGSRRPGAVGFETTGMPRTGVEWSRATRPGFEWSYSRRPSLGERENAVTSKGWSGSGRARVGLEMTEMGRPATDWSSGTRPGLEWNYGSRPGVEWSYAQKPSLQGDVIEATGISARTIHGLDWSGSRRSGGVGFETIGMPRTGVEWSRATRPGFEWSYSGRPSLGRESDAVTGRNWSGRTGVRHEITEMRRPATDWSSGTRPGLEWSYGSRPGVEWSYPQKPSLQGDVIEAPGMSARTIHNFDWSGSRRPGAVGFETTGMPRTGAEWSRATRPGFEWSYSGRPSLGGVGNTVTGRDWSGRTGVGLEITEMRRPGNDWSSGTRPGLELSYGSRPGVEWSYPQKPSLQGNVVEAPAMSARTIHGLDWSGSRRPGAVGFETTGMPRTGVEWSRATRPGFEWSYSGRPSLGGVGDTVTGRDWRGSDKTGVGLEITEMRRPANDWSSGARPGLEWSYGSRPGVEWSYAQKPSLQEDVIEAPGMPARTIHGLDWSGSERPGAVGVETTGMPRTGVEWSCATRPGFEWSYSRRPSLGGVGDTVTGRDWSGGDRTGVGLEITEMRRPANDWSSGTRPGLEWSYGSRPGVEWSYAQKPSLQGDVIEAPGMSARTIHGLDWSGSRRPGAVGFESTGMPRTCVEWSRATRPGFESSYSGSPSLGGVGDTVTGRDWSGSGRTGVGLEITEMRRPANDWSSDTRPGLEFSYGSRPGVEWSYPQKPSLHGDVVEASAMSARTIHGLDWSGSRRPGAVGFETTGMPRTGVEWSRATRPGFEWSYSGRPSLGGVGDTFKGRDWSGSGRTGVGLEITEMRRPGSDWSSGTRPGLELSYGSRPGVEWSYPQKPSLHEDVVEAPAMSAKTIHGLDWSGSERPDAVGFDTTGMPRTGVEWSRATRPGFEWSYSGRPSLGGVGDTVTGRDWSGSDKTGVGLEITEMRRPANDWSSGTRPGLQWSHGSRPGVEWSYAQKPSLQGDMIETPGMSAGTIHGLDWSGSERPDAVSFDTTGMPRTGVEWSRATRPGFEWSYSGRPSLGGVEDTVTGRDWSGSDRTRVGLEITEMRRPANDWSSGTPPGLEWSYGSRPGVEWSYAQKPSLQGDVVEAPGMSARTIHGLDWSGSRRPGAVGFETTGMPRTGVEWSRATRPGFEWSHSGRPSLGGVGDTVTGRDWSGSGRTGVGLEITEMRRPGNDWSSGTRPGLELSYGSRPGVEWSYPQKPSLHEDVVEAPAMSARTIHGLDWSGSRRSGAVGFETTGMPRTGVEWSRATRPGFESSYSGRPSLRGVENIVTGRDWSRSGRTGVGPEITEMRRPASDWSSVTRPGFEWSYDSRPGVEWSYAQKPSLQRDVIEAPGMPARMIHGLDWSGSVRPDAVGFDTTGMPRTGVEWSRATRPGFEWSYSGRPSLGGVGDTVTGRDWSGSDRTGVGLEITEMRRPANDWSSGTRPGLQWSYGSRPGVEWSYAQKPSLQGDMIEAPGMSAGTIHGLDWSGGRRPGAVGFERTGMPRTGVEWSRATRPGFEWSYSGKPSLGGIGDTVTGREWSGSDKTEVGLEITEMRRPANDWSSGTRPGLQWSYGSRPGVEWSYAQKSSLQGDMIEAPGMSAGSIHPLDWSGSGKPGAVGIKTTRMPRTVVEWSHATRPGFEWSYSGRPSLGGIGDTGTGRYWSGSDRTGVGLEITEMKRPANDWSSGTRPGLEWSYGSRPGVEWSHAQKPSLQGDLIEAPGMSPRTVHGLDWSGSRRPGAVGFETTGMPRTGVEWSRATRPGFEWSYSGRPSLGGVGDTVTGKDWSGSGRTGVGLEVTEVRRPANGWSYGTRPELEWSSGTRPELEWSNVQRPSFQGDMIEAPVMSARTMHGLDRSGSRRPGTVSIETTGMPRTGVEWARATRPGFEWSYSRGPSLGEVENAVTGKGWSGSGRAGVVLGMTEMGKPATDWSSGTRPGLEWNYGSRPAVEWSYAQKPSLQGDVIEANGISARTIHGLDWSGSGRPDAVGFETTGMPRTGVEWSRATRPGFEWSYSGRPSLRAVGDAVTGRNWSGRIGVGHEITEMRRPANDWSSGTRPGLEWNYGSRPGVDWSYPQKPSLQGDVIEAPSMSARTIHGLDWTGSRKSGVVGFETTGMPRTGVERSRATRPGFESSYSGRPSFGGVENTVTGRDWSRSGRAGVGLEITEMRPASDWSSVTRPGLEWSYGSRPGVEWSYPQKPSLQRDVIEAHGMPARTIHGLDWSGSGRPDAVGFETTGMPRTDVEWSRATRPSFEWSYSGRPSLGGVGDTVTGRDWSGSDRTGVGLEITEMKRPANDWSSGTRPGLEWSYGSRPEVEWNYAQKPSLQGDMIEAPGMSAGTIHGLDWSDSRRPGAVGFKTTGMPRTGVEWSRATRPGFEWSYSGRPSLGGVGDTVTGRDWSGSDRTGVGLEITEMRRPANDWSSGTRPGLKWSYGSRPGVEWSYAQKPSLHGDMIEAPGILARTIQGLDWSGIRKPSSVGLEMTGMPRTDAEWIRASRPGFERSYSGRQSLPGVEGTVIGKDWIDGGKAEIGLEMSEMNRPANDWSYGTRAGLELNYGSRPGVEWISAQRPSFQGDMTDASGMSAGTLQRFDLSGSRRPGTVSFEMTEVPKTDIEWSRATGPGFKLSYSERPSLERAGGIVTGKDWSGSGRVGLGLEVPEIRRPGIEGSYVTRPGLEWSYGRRPGHEWSYEQRPPFQGGVMEAPSMSARTIQGLDWNGSRRPGAVGLEMTRMPRTGVEWTRVTRPGFERSYSARQSFPGVEGTVIGKDWIDGGGAETGLDMSEMKRPANDDIYGTRPGLEWSYGSRPGVEWNYAQKPSLQGDVMEVPSISSRTIHGIDWTGSRRPGGLSPYKQVDEMVLDKSCSDSGRVNGDNFEITAMRANAEGNIGDKRGVEQFETLLEHPGLVQRASCPVCPICPPCPVCPTCAACTQNSSNYV